MIEMLINGRWTAGSGARRVEVINPATEEKIGEVPVAEPADVEAALAAAGAAFREWRQTPALKRSDIMRAAAQLIRSRAEVIATAITTEQGKPLREALVEVMAIGEHLDWNAEEGRRVYGRTIPGRDPSLRFTAIKEPVGPVACFGPWNFPALALMKKVAAALGAGCSVVAKGCEEAPTAGIMVFRALEEAGLPKGVANLLFGVPAEISEQLIASPVIRKISFTGSVPVGQKLGALAGQYVKRTTMELGGHAPFIVCADADVEKAARQGVDLKFRNAGQVCTSPTRFYVEAAAFDGFVESFLEKSSALKIGHGLETGVDIGPLVRERRVQVMEDFVADAANRGIAPALGGARLANRGYFFPPTILLDLPDDARLMTEEPFGPVAIINRVTSVGEAVEKANSLPFSLAAYAHTRSLDTAQRLIDSLETGLVGLNSGSITSPETPFGGVKDSGFGSEGGIEGLDAFLSTKFVSQAGA